MNLSRESDDNRCRHCGAHVTHDFRRVYGDQDGNVHRCRECDTAVRIQQGSAAGRDVRTPDPQESPGRHGNIAGRWSE
ncbi:DUF7563 family protein [Halobellus inordinatus]|uniref:DUF7563 family protein n=1 Tax=Halobellus inordinatus TaxID=1126236 RepID=UPI00211485A7|nr:DUF6510 family protein [Halobellus ramosii]